MGLMYNLKCGENLRAIQIQLMTPVECPIKAQNKVQVAHIENGLLCFFVEDREGFPPMK